MQEKKASPNQQSQQFKPNRQQRRNAAKWQREQEAEARQKALKAAAKKPRAKEHKAMPAPTVLYECDPVKNAGCPKTSCFLGGGPCHQTTKLEFARQPVKTVKMVLPVDEATRQDLVRQYAAELKEAADLNQTAQISEEVKRSAGLT